MQILAFSLVPVVLGEIHGFILVIGWFSPVFAGLDRSRSIARSTALGAGPALADAGPNARPERGAQYKT